MSLFFNLPNAGGIYMDQNTLQLACNLMDACSNAKRVEMLRMIKEKTNPMEMAGKLNLSRPGLQGHIDKSKTLRLVTYTSKGGYQLTSHGEAALRLIKVVEAEAKKLETSLHALTKEELIDLLL